LGGHGLTPGGGSRWSQDTKISRENQHQVSAAPAMALLTLARFVKLFSTGLVAAILFVD
jgi:hypothetical protein